VDPQVSHPLRHVLLDEAWERLPLRMALPLVVAETIGLSVLFVAYSLLDAVDSVLAPLLIPPVVTLMILIAIPRSVSSRPLRILVSYAIATGTGLLLTAVIGHELPATILIGFLTLLAMHLTGTLHPPAVAMALVASTTTLPGSDDILALFFVLAVVLGVIAWAWLGHRLLGDREYPRRWW
jgi:CBS-domain-containing membrane protein